MDLTTIVYICILIGSIATLYDRLTRGIPSRLRTREAPKSATGFVRADAFNTPDKHARAHGVDVIFVHGLGSNPDTTWNLKGSNWVRDFLPDDIPAASREDVRIFFYNYDSYWKRDAIETRLWRLGEGLVNSICSQIRVTAEEQARGLIFVAHSYGGLVIKRALIQASQDASKHHITKNTRGVIFLGTPHRGSKFVTWGSVAAQALQPIGANPALLQEVTYDALPLMELHQDFEKVMGENLQAVNFFEQRKTRLLKLWFFHWEKFCVEEQSATFSRADNLGLQVDHYGLNKFSSKNDHGYQSILAKLVGLIEPVLALKPPRLYSVPFTTVDTYTPREALSTAIANSLKKRHENASVPYAVAIHGFGGAGKTQLALRYVEEHGNDYDPILWYDATDEGSLLSSYERCARELNCEVTKRQPPGTSLVHSGTVRNVIRKLESRTKSDGKWLVIMDNADDLSWGLKQLLPKGHQGSIIITSQDNMSRTELIDKGCESVCVETMQQAEARALLLHHMDMEADSSADEVLDSCDKLAKQLDYLALAVDLAGTFIRHEPDRKLALLRYLKDLALHKDDLLRDERLRGLRPREKTVWTVWDTTLERIEKLESLENPPMGPAVPARLLLVFLAYFDGDIVFDEEMRIGSSIMMHDNYPSRLPQPTWLKNLFTREEATEDGAGGSAWDDYHYAKARGLLVRYGLIQRHNGKNPGVSMHGLVRWRAKRYDEEQPWEMWHLMVLLEYYKYDSGKHHPFTLCTMDNLALQWDRLGYTDGALELLRATIEGNTSAFGPQDFMTLLSTLSLAGIWWRQDHSNDALKLLETVNEEMKVTLGSEHTLVLRGIEAYNTAKESTKSTS